MGQCYAPNCKSHTRSKCRMFQLPVNQERKRKWIIKCREDGWVPVPNAFLCALGIIICLWIAISFLKFEFIIEKVFPQIYSIEALVLSQFHLVTPVLCHSSIILLCNCLQTITGTWSYILIPCIGSMQMHPMAYIYQRTSITKLTSVADIFSNTLFPENEVFILRRL